MQDLKTDHSETLAANSGLTKKKSGAFKRLNRRNRRLCSSKGSQTPKAPPAEAYQQVSDDDDRHEEGQTRGRTRDLHAVPEKLSP